MPGVGSSSDSQEAVGLAERHSLWLERRSAVVVLAGKKGDGGMCSRTDVQDANQDGRIPSCYWSNRAQVGVERDRAPQNFLNSPTRSGIAHPPLRTAFEVGDRQLCSRLCGCCAARPPKKTPIINHTTMLGAAQQGALRVGGRTLEAVLNYAQAQRRWLSASSTLRGMSITT